MPSVWLAHRTRHNFVPMRRFCALAITVGFASMDAHAQVSPSPLGNWPQHSMTRPQPAVVDPGPFVASTRAPSDAIVLFDGRSLDNWESSDKPGEPARWKVASGYMEVVPKTGS